MDPNKVWDDIMVDVSLLHDLLSDSEYAHDMEWKNGTKKGDVRDTLSANLIDLAYWIKKGGFPPDPFADLEDVDE